MKKTPSPALVVACVALFVALGGPAQAAKLLSGSKIKSHSITARQIKASTITSKEIRNRTITSGDIASKTLSSLKAQTNAVTSTQIVDGTVSLADMAFGSVTGNQVVDRSLSAVDIAAGSLTANELATGSVGDAQLAANAVLNNKIRTGAVTKGKIATAAVGTEELIDGNVRGTDLGADTLTATVPALTASGTAGGCGFANVTIPAQRTSANRIVLVGQVADDYTLTARATGDTTLSLKFCNTTGAATAAGPSVTVPYVVIGA